MCAVFNIPSPRLVTPGGVINFTDNASEGFLHEEFVLPQDNHLQSIFGKSRPSLGYYFANLDEIRQNVRTDFDIDKNEYLYLYRNRNTKVSAMAIADIDDTERAFDVGKNDIYEKNLIDRIAKLYDKAIIEEVVKMPMENFENLKRAVCAAGGEIEFESSMDMLTRANVTLRIPMHNLDPFYTMLSNGKTDPKPNTIPEIKDIKIQNNMVVVVYFEDGSFTKSICKDGETFNVYTGVMVCLFKRMLGESKDEKVYGQKKFTRMMDKAMSFFTRKEKELKKAREEKKARIEAEKVKQNRNLRRKSKKREEQIRIFAEALKRDRIAVENEKYDRANSLPTSNEDV